MRNALISKLHDLSLNDTRIMNLIADTGAFLFRHIKQDRPRQFLNGGIAEANLIGVASGLALSGYVPVVYGIAAFFIRAFDQIRVDVCQNMANVKIVGVGAGISYSTVGPSHHTIEDLAMFRALPHMTILSPSDPLEAAWALEAALALKTPVYIRLGLAGEPSVHSNGVQAELSKIQILRQGTDVAILATGRCVKRALDAAESLAEHVSSQVVNVHTIKPIDVEGILTIANNVQAIVTVEEHNILGGLGSAVAEILVQSKHDHPIGFKSLGIQDTFCSEYGNGEYLINHHGLSAKAIAQEVLKIARMGCN